MADKKWKVFFLFSLLLLLSLLLLIHFHYAFFSLLFLQRPLLINYNAGILMTNGMLWNIHKIARYGDTYMILDRHKLKFSGNLLIEKVNVSVAIFHCLHFVLFCFVLILHLVSIGLQRMNVRSIFSLFLFMDPGVGRNALKRFKTGSTNQCILVGQNSRYTYIYYLWSQVPKMAPKTVYTDTRKQLTNSNGHRRSWNVCLFVTSLKMRAMSRRMFKISTWNWVAIAQWTKKCQIYGISCK